MIQSFRDKKSTIEIFSNGKYAGEHNWSGGIPLIVGEIISVLIKSGEIIYKPVDKKPTLQDLGDDQIIR